MTITALQGDSREVLTLLGDDSIDAVLTDPPYALVSIGKRFGKTSQEDDTQTSEKARGRVDAYARASAGFMGKQWDTGETAFAESFWAEVYRVLKPGGHMLVFGGTRTYHRLVCAIEDAGFEIRDQVAWVYGTGFPKSHTVDPFCNAETGQEFAGWGTALKPAFEPICLARKPLTSTVAMNVLEHGTGAINIDACRVGAEPVSTHSRGENGAFPKRPLEKSAEESGRTQDQREGLSHAERLGRFPANFIHDGSDEVIALFPDSKGQQGISRTDREQKTDAIYGAMKDSPVEHIPRGDSGSAARFFYCAKASKADRHGSKHPTVKPIALLRYLAKLITPPGGTILDPFAGSGTTGEAAQLEGFNAMLIEREDEYYADIEKRIADLEAA